MQKHLSLEKIYTALIIVLSVGVLMRTYSLVLVMPALFVLMALLDVLGQNVRFQMAQGELSAEHALHVYVYFTYGAPLLIWVLLFANAAYFLVRRFVMQDTRSMTKILFNSFQYVPIVAIADWVVQSMPLASMPIALRNFSQVIIFSVMFLVINHLLVNFFFITGERELFTLRNMGRTFLIDSLLYAVSLPFAYLMLITQQTWGLTGFLMLYTSFIIFVTGINTYYQYREANKELKGLYEVSATLSQSLDLDKVLNSILDATGQIVAYDVLNVFLIDDKGDSYYSRVSRGELSYVLEDKTFPLNKGVSGAAMLSREPVLVHNKVEALTYHSLNQHFESVLSVPLIHAGRVWGAITVASEIQDAFTQRHVRQLRIFSRYAAISVCNADRYAQVRTKAITDELTGLFNYHHFITRLNDELEATERTGEPLSLIMADIDWFKQINDTYGHQVGNKILVQLADIIESSVREQDLVARFGGEEFSIILPNTDKTLATKIAERIRYKVSTSSFDVAKKEVSLLLTISLGVASYFVDATNQYELIDAADQALYEHAKEKGRNRVGVAGKAS